METPISLPSSLKREEEREKLTKETKEKSINVEAHKTK